MRITVLILLASATTFAQGPTVPHRISFAGMTLVIRDDARKEIQKDVDLFTQSPKYFNIKVERAKLYFPIIEKIFESERVPDDFKYLVIQESALISDAVSSSNAVGFWQFKDFTALEMGLRVDREIDERKNIVSASRAAAKYIKKNNFYFNNWLYALQAYQMGAGGVMQHVHDYQSGAKHMEITSKTYWYVKKFLAHKIAYENAISGSGLTKAVLFETRGKSKLSDLAKDFAVDEEELKSYNKWVLRNSIPDDKAYTVLIPTTGDSRDLQKAVARVESSSKAEAPLASTNAPIVPIARKSESRHTISKSEYVFINGIPAIKAIPGENVTSFANRVSVDLSYFLKFNDISITDRIIPGEYYFVKKKNVRASTRKHTTESGESLWSISQKYGVQLRKLKKYNSNVPDGPLREGMTVLLTKNQKVNLPLDESQPILEVSQQDEFNWSVKPDTEDSPMLQASANQIIPVTPSREDEKDAVETVDRNVGKATLTSKDNSHTVIAGETLYAISKRYGVTIAEIVAWNDLKPEEGIQPGQILQLAGEDKTPEKKSEATTGGTNEIVHEVKSSETLYSVARKYGVTIKELMDWNHKTDFTISAGDKLKILQKP